MRKSRSKMTDEQRRKSEHWRNDASKFMRDRFHAQCLWEMNGPENTDVDWMLFFAYEGGTAVIMTWLAGGWSIWTDGAERGEYDKTEDAIRAQLEARRSPIVPISHKQALDLVVVGITDLDTPLQRFAAEDFETRDGPVGNSA